MKKQINSMLVAVFALAVAPAASGEDAYIESDGTHGLNTGYCVTNSSRIELDFAMVDIVDQYRLFSSGIGNSGGNTNNLQCDCYIGTSGGVQMFSIRYVQATEADMEHGKDKGYNVYAADTNRHTIVADFAAASQHFQIWTAGTMVKSQTFATPILDNGRSTVPIALFAKNYNEYALSFGRFAKMKVYRFKAYEDGDLVMDLEPCVKGGVAGFKDNCRPGRFVMSEDVKACTAGGDVEEIPDDPYLYSPRNTFSSVAGKSIYLDTNYTVTPTTRVELDYAMLTADWSSSDLYSQDPYIIGCTGTDVVNNVSQGMVFYAAGKTKSAGYYNFRLGSDSERSITALKIATAYNVRRTVAMDGSSIKIVTAGYTNYSYTVASGKELLENITKYTLKIGASFTGETRFLPMKVYGLKIYESDVLVKDYRPFITNSVAGFVNALDETDALYSFTYKGSRTDGGAVATNLVFSAGGSISNDAEEKEAYLEFDGVDGHKINTGYSISKDSCLEIDFAPWNTPYNKGFDMLGHGGGSAKIVWARLYCNSAYGYSYYFADATKSPSGVALGVRVSNARIQVKLDGYNSKAIVTSGGKTLKNLNITTAHTAAAGDRNLYIGASYSGGTRSSCIRLYSFKISEAGDLKRHYVPCTHEGQAGLYDLCEGEFYPLTGGKVYGKGYKGQGERGTFEVSPQPAKITKGAGSDTLTCLAPGASSFAWYKDGVLIEGETTDSLTVAWSRKEAGVATYSVRPVYTVFNEKVLGDAATAQVEMTPVGMMISVQ